jgi:CHAT domain
MRPELRITFVPAGRNGLNLHVEAPSLPKAGEYHPREILDLGTDTIRRFRLGDLNQTEVNDVVKKINEWLLDAKLRQVIGQCLGPNRATKKKLMPDERLNVVFALPDETRDYVTNLPFELLYHDTPQRPLPLRPDVASISYLLSRVSDHADAPGISSPPLKILILRSNPPDLGGGVPEVAGLRSHIMSNAARYGNGNVQVDVLSCEKAIGTSGTWQALRDHLRLTNDYIIFVYLGHGALTEGDEPIGQLYMESDDGLGHQPINAPMIARLFARYPIPVVVLAGCITATQAAGTTPGGDQGVAQALINSSEAGVQVAIGMRMELQTEAASTFLTEFFTSLFAEDSVGDIDQAIWSARNELYLKMTHPPQWAAPVVFRASLREPFIDFLTKESKFLVTPEMNKFRDIRSTLWKLLPKQNTPEVGQLLEGIETSLRAEAMKQGPLLLPILTRIAQNSDGFLPVALAGSLKVSRLRARILLGGSGTTPRSVAVNPTAQAAGFRLMFDPDDPSFFELSSRTGAALQLPEGELLRLTVSVGDQQPGLYPVTLEVDLISPPRAIVWLGDTVIVVPGP